MDTTSQAKVFYCESQRDSVAQIILLGINILFTFITAVLTGLRVRAKSPCFEVSTKPASAPYSPGSVAGTPVPVGSVKPHSSSKDDLMNVRPRNVQRLAGESQVKTSSPLGMTSVVVEPTTTEQDEYKSP